MDIFLIHPAESSAGGVNTSPSPTPVPLTGSPGPVVSASPSPSPSASPNTTLANPASQYCQQVGGTSQTLEDQSGNQVGVCTFPDGSSIEEFTLFRGPNDPANAMLTQAL